MTHCRVGVTTSVFVVLFTNGILGACVTVHLYVLMVLNIIKTP